MGISTGAFRHSRTRVHRTVNDKVDVAADAAKVLQAILTAIRNDPIDFDRL